MAAAEFAEVSLVVNVWDFNGGILKDDFIGRIVLGKYGTGELSLDCRNSRRRTLNFGFVVDRNSGNHALERHVRSRKEFSGPVACFAVP